MRFWKVLTLTLLILLALPTVGRAVGLDLGPVVAKLTEQLTEMAKQLDELKKTSQAVEDQAAAIGDFGSISIPIINSTRLGSQITQDLQCLKPDLEKLMPNISFEELNWNSVCQAGSAYRKTLWLDPEQIKELPSWKSREAATREVKIRRENVLSDATEKGMALSDTAQLHVDNTKKAADEIDKEADRADDEQKRFATLIKAQVALLRAQAHQNQLLATMLKVQSATALHIGVPVESMMEEGDKK